MLVERSDIRQDGRVRRAVRALDGAGHHVLLLHRGDDDDDPALAGDGGRRRSVLGRGWTRRALERAARRPGLWASFAWQAARSRPDVVHAHDLPMLAPGWLAARASGAALVYDTHEYATDVWHLGRLTRLVARLLERSLAPRCSAVVTVSPQTADRLARRYALVRPPVVVRNVPLLDWPGASGAGAQVADLRAALGIGDAQILLHQGAAGPGRGLVEIIAALAELPGVHLVQLGDNTSATRRALAQAARQAGVTDRFHQVPGVPIEVLLEHARQADVGVSVLDPQWLNHRLTLPNKLFEYLAAGLPVVVTRATASGEVVESLGVGWTVPFGDHAALVEALGEALARHDERELRDRVTAAARTLSWADERSRLVGLYAALGLEE